MPEAERDLTDMASQAQVLANTENAQLSTGPKSESGKSISKLNAYRHGLTAQTVVFSPEEAEAFTAFSADMLFGLSAIGTAEQQIAEEMVITRWRLNRVPALEANLIVLGRLEPAPSHLALLEDSPVKTALLESHALIVHERPLRNLQLQEQRLRRHLLRLTLLIAAHQTARETEAAHNVEFQNSACEQPPAKAATAALLDRQPEPIGFDFANLDSEVPDPALHLIEARVRLMRNASQHAEMRKQHEENRPTRNVQPAL